MQGAILIDNIANDFAKFGRLFLNDGLWNGNRIISKKWIEKSTRKIIDSKNSFYAYQWWHDGLPDKNGVVNFSARKLGELHPIHLLGIGDPNDIWNLVKDGIDTFDCVSPTRLARHGSALIRSKKGKLNIKNSQYESSLEAIDSKCNCSTCKNYSLSYIHHLFKTEELLGLQLLTIHNIYFMNSLMVKIREAINSDNLDKAELNWYKNHQLSRKNFR